jgi:uncharacterized protein YbbK (DUF523 family)
MNFIFISYCMHINSVKFKAKKKKKTEKNRKKKTREEISYLTRKIEPIFERG